MTQDLIKPLYPIYLDLSGALCLVVGGGRVAERKIHRLLAAGARVRIIAPQAAEALRELAEQKKIVWEPREASLADLECENPEDKPALVFLCSSDSELQRAMAKKARECGLLANVADSPEESGFHVPAVARSGRVQAAISTGGASPGLAGDLKERIEQWLDPAYGECAAILAELRRRAIDSGAPGEEWRPRLERLLDGRLLQTLREQGFEAARDLADRIMQGE